MLISNRPISKKDSIVKYHNSRDNFKKDEIKSVMKFIRKNTSVITDCWHYELREEQKHISHKCSLDDILQYGECFEYKLLNDKYLYRLAIRMAGKKFDTIYVIQPTYKKGRVFVTFITAYNNASGDNHETLDVSQYQ